MLFLIQNMLYEFIDPSIEFWICQSTILCYVLKNDTFSGENNNSTLNLLNFLNRLVQLPFMDLFIINFRDIKMRIRSTPV